MERRNLERPIPMTVRVTAEEKEMIELKMSQAGTSNFSLYARKMLIDGYVIRRDFSELKKITKELGFIARCINQIAKRANETRNIYEQDIEDLRSYFYNIKRAVSERLVKMIRD